MGFTKSLVRLWFFWKTNTLTGLNSAENMKGILHGKHLSNPVPMILVLDSKAEVLILESNFGVDLN